MAKYVSIDVERYIPKSKFIETLNITDALYRNWKLRGKIKEHHFKQIGASLVDTHSFKPPRGYTNVFI